MFQQARIRLTAVYTLLLGLTLLVVVGVIALLVIRDENRSDDLQLRLRVQAEAARVAQTPAGVTPTAPVAADDRDADDDPDDRLEEEGILTFVLPLQAGSLQQGTAPSLGTLPALPAATRALQQPDGRFATIDIPGGQARLFSQPVFEGGTPVAVVQGARSRSFVNNAIRRLVLISLAGGLAGLAASALAGFWLAGLTLRPIAETLRRQRAFTADASHELRTPVTIVRGNAETLARHRERPIAEYDELVQDMISESEHLTRLIADMLTLARMDEDQPPLATTQIGFSRVVAEVARRFERLAAERSLVLKATVAADVMVRGDAERLSQLVAILLDNAVRYTERGEILIELVARGRQAELSVQDTGPGIAPEHLPRLFDRFYRADSARSSTTGGSGLGLAIAQQTATIHHGRLTVESKLGEGTCFHFQMPTIA